MLDKLVAFALFTILATAPSVTAQQKAEIKRVPPENTSITSGAEMFGTYCAVCHGVDGKGNGPAAPALAKQPPDLTQLSKKNGGKFPTFIVSNVILGDEFIAAHGSRDMPMWGDVFRSKNRDESAIKLRRHNLTVYVESLQQK